MTSHVAEFPDGQVSERERFLSGSGTLVSSGVQAAVFEERSSLAGDAILGGAKQLEASCQWEGPEHWKAVSSSGCPGGQQVRASGGQEGVRASRESFGSGCESIWQVGEMQSVRREAELHSLLREQPTGKVKDQEQDRSDVCAPAEGDPYGWISRKLDEGEGSTTHPSRCHQSRSAEGSSTADWLPGGGDLQSSHAVESNQHDVAADHAADDPESVQQQQSSSWTSDTRTNASSTDASCDQFRCRDGDGEPQSAGLGERGPVRSLWSVLKDRNVSHQDCTDPNWLVAPLSSCSLAQLAKLEEMEAAVWQPDDGGCFVVWKDQDLVGDLIASDDFDDHEFQVRRSDKRNLLSFLQHSFVAGNSKNSDPSHFASELRINGSKKSEYGGEDARTSRNENKKEEQEQNEYRGGDARTPRSQECVEQERQEAKAHHNQAVVSNPLVAGLAGHVSPLRLSFLSGRTCRSHGSYKICEVFSPPRVTPVASHEGFSVTEPPAFDLETGWNFRNGQHRAHLWHVLRTQEPDLVILSPECRPFSVLMNSNWSKMSPQEVKSIQAEGLSMLHFCVQIAEFQISQNKHFLLEHPGGASSWQTHALKWLLQQENVVRFLFDQCAVGLSVTPDTLSRKVTGIVTNNLGIASTLSKCQCSCVQPHQQLQQGLPKKAQVYPPGMIHKIMEGIKVQLKEFSAWSFAQVEEDEDVIEIEDEDADEHEKENSERPITEAQISSQEKEKVRLLHNNMGHLPKPQMLSLLKAAGGKNQVLRYVQDEFHCHQCMRQQRPISRRKAAFPRVFSFNRIIGIDFMYISWEGKTLAFLNIVCHGTNLQQVGWLKEYDGGSPSSKACWELFSQLWVRPFGLPEVLISDGGGEFRYDFERCAEQAGILHVISDASSPWQNGRAERHGGWIKTRIEQEIQSGQSIIQTAKELEMLIISLVSHKNRWFHRGGFSPYQLTFGANPRIPLELLGDDATHLTAISDVTADAFEQDSAAAEFARSHAIRQKARELCVASAAKDRIRLSTQGHSHKQRQWFPGQWVYVWRRFAGTGQGHVTKSRWSGPGLVLQQSGHTVWVSMRARLLKCNSDQLRSASHEEAIGAELLKDGHIKDLVSQTSSHRAGAIDVASEGAPPVEAWDGVPVPDIGDVSNALPQTNSRLPTIQETNEGEDEQQQQQQTSVTPAIGAAPTTPMVGKG